MPLAEPGRDLFAEETRLVSASVLVPEWQSLRSRAGWSSLHSSPTAAVGGLAEHLEGQDNVEGQQRVTVREQVTLCC